MPHYFPQEIWSDILLYLPAICLCRFSLVSRSFHAMITNPDFIYKHMITSLNKKNNIVIEPSSSNNNSHGNSNVENLAILVRRYIGVDQDEYTLIKGGPNLSAPSRLFLEEIVFPHGSKQGDDKIVSRGYGLKSLVSSLVGGVGKIILSDDSRLFLRELVAGRRIYQMDYKIGGTGYGLMCLFNCLEDGSADKIILWNPSIRKSITLPEPLIRTRSHNNLLVGSGVDFISRDFKVVRIVFGGTLLWTANQIVRFEPNRAEVYSLTRNNWTELVEPNVQCNGHVFYNFQPIMLKGCPHWLAARNREHPSFILTFNMSTEEFSDIMTPAEWGFGKQIRLCYNLSRETPTIVEYIDIGPNNRRSCIIWVMMEYGVVESWNTMCSFELVPGMGEVIGFQEEGCKVLVSKTGNELIVYETETCAIKELGIFGSASSFFVNNYMESLLLLKNNLLGE